MKEAKKVNSNESANCKVSRRTRFTRFYRMNHVNLVNILSILSTFDLGCSVHQLLHARNNHEFERAIRLRRLLNLRQTLLAPISRWRPPELQVSERLQSSRAELRKIVRERLDLFQRR